MENRTGSQNEGEQPETSGWRKVIANFKSILVVFSTKKEKTNFYNDIIDAFTVRRY